MELHGMEHVTGLPRSWEFTHAWKSTDILAQASSRTETPSCLNFEYEVFDLDSCPAPTSLAVLLCLIFLLLRKTSCGPHVGPLWGPCGAQVGS